MNDEYQMRMLIVEILEMLISNQNNYSKRLEDKIKILYNMVNKCESEETK